LTATVRDVGGDNAQSALIDDFEVGVLQQPPRPRRRVPRGRDPLEQGARERNRRRGHGDHDVASGFENATEFPERGGLVKELQRLGRVPHPPSATRLAPWVRSAEMTASWLAR
jgi:hypothetical protein